MNIYDPKNKDVVNAIKFCLNWGNGMKLLGVKYSTDKEIYKCRVFDPNWGGRTTIRLDEKFVRHAIQWIQKGGKALWTGN